MTLPPATVNRDWAQPGGNATKSMGQLALGTTLSPRSPFRPAAAAA